MFLPLIILIIAIPLFITFKFRNTKYFVPLKNITIVIVVILTLVIGIAVWDIYRKSTTNVVQVFNCDSNKFSFVNIGNSGTNLQKNYNQNQQNTNTYIGEVKINQSNYTVIYSNNLGLNNIPDSTTKEFDQFQKQGFKELVNCKEFKYNALYQADPNDYKQSCYLLNRNNLTDYPECSKEIKTEFGIV